MRLVRYIITNSVFAACLWFGIIHGVSGAANVGLLMAWWSICISVFLTNSDVINEMRKNGRTVPLWLDQIFDATVLLFMIWHSWWITGTGYLFHMVMVSAAHRKAFSEQQPSNTRLMPPAATAGNDGQQSNPNKESP